MVSLAGLSIRWKLLIPVILIFLTTVAQIYLVVSMNRMQQEDTVRVNVAGRQRMLSQKIDKETLNFLHTKEAVHAKAQADTIATFERISVVVLGGGQLDLSGRTAEVKPTEHEEIVAALKEADQYWQKVKPVFLAAAEPPSGARQIDVNQLNEISLQILKRFDAITGMYEIASAAAIKRDMTLIYVGLCFYLLAAVSAWYYVQKSFIMPILALRDAASRIAARNLSQ
ncbi:MAG: type IV pili methyl-accepting chemotaxis transducer N-terminal domain-containing protein [Firmicutes bacterium]|nr:type IV pili methyl-accepting chemotaxis transducer N-terminal domain-containing protein [Bacillota bacterium]